MIILEARQYGKLVLEAYSYACYITGKLTLEAYRHTLQKKKKKTWVLLLEARQYGMVIQEADSHVHAIIH